MNPFTPATRESTSPALHTRMVVPDVARGVGLLGATVAMAGTTWFSPGTLTVATSFGGVREGSIFDQFVVMFCAMFVHHRAMPLFATLLGLGVGLIATNLWNRGLELRRTKVIMVRRYFAIAVIGIIHAALFTHGDMLVVLGAGGIITALLLGVGEKTMTRIVALLVSTTVLVAFIISIMLLVIPHSESMFITVGPLTASSYTDYLVESIWQFSGDLLYLPLYLMIYLPAMFVGAAWAQRGVLTNISAHTRELRYAVYLAAALSLLIGLPWGLASLNYLPDPWSQILGQLNFYLGPLAGPGLLALVALTLRKVQDCVLAGGPLPGPLAVIASLGKFSLSAYVASCVLLMLLSQPFALGFGEGNGAGAIALVGASVWLSMLAAAWIWDSMELQGLLEFIVRRVSYGPRQRPAKDPQ